MIALVAVALGEEPATAPAPAPVPAPVPVPEPAPAPNPAPVPAPAPAPVAPLPEPAAEEIVVYAELRERQARARVVQLLEDLGYGDEVIDQGDRTVYRHADPWKGEVMLYDDGWYDVKRQPVRIEGRRMPWAETDSPLAWAGCVVWPWLCIRASGGTIGHRKWLGVTHRTVEVVAGPTQEWGDRVADLATERTVLELPDRLQALWDAGTALDGGPTLPTPEARRAALLAYYASRTDTVWGEAVRRAIGSFVRGVVQPSDTPFTDAEIDRFHAEHPGVLSPFLPARDPAE